MSATTTPLLSRGTVTQSPTECTLELEDGPINAGRVRFTAVNETDGQILFDMWRLLEGHSFDEWTAATQQARLNAEAGGPHINAPPYLEDLTRIKLQPGETAPLVRTVQPATYGIVCLRPFPAVGMRPFALLGPIEIKQPSARP